MTYLHIVKPPAYQIYTLSLHDALPIFFTLPQRQPLGLIFGCSLRGGVTRLGLTFATPIRSVLAALGTDRGRDRKSTRLNSSHVKISYAVFCLKKKKKHSSYTFPTEANC